MRLLRRFKPKYCSLWRDEALYFLGIIAVIALCLVFSSLTWVYAGLFLLLAGYVLVLGHRIRSLQETHKMLQEDLNTIIISQRNTGRAQNDALTTIAESVLEQKKILKSIFGSPSGQSKN